MHALLVLGHGAAPARRDLPGPAVTGGSRADDIHLPGCPAGALRLVPCAAGVVVEAVVGGVRAGGHPVPPGGRRLLRPGERAELQGAAIEVVRASPPAETRAAAAEVLRDAAEGAAAPAGLHLVVLSGPAAGARHPLGGDQTLGRGRAATILLPDPTASRVHARVTVSADGARVEDLGSKNGVRVNGVRIERRPRLLRSGDELVVGETVLALADGAPLPSDVPDPPGPARQPLPRRALAALLLALSAAALALAAS